MDNQELVSQLVSNARKALVEFEKYNQEQVDACVKAVLVAFGVLDALQREGYRVPEDFSLCGFDNVTTSGYQRIQLTTVDNNTFSHGKSAFNLLLERIEGGLNSREDQPINRVEYRSRLIVRGSTGKPRSGGL